MLLGTVGAIPQITGISQVVTDVGDPLSIAAYAGGVGMDVQLGLVARDRLTRGRIAVTIITNGPGAAAGRGPGDGRSPGRPVTARRARSTSCS
jgi:uncharacterized protein YebE (UPF0316 family)